MVDQTNPDAYSEGVSGKGQKWKDRVTTDKAKQNYSGGATSDNASKLTSRAKEKSDDYAENLAAAFGVESVDSDITSRWEDGLDSDAESAWTQNTADAADEWEDGVGRVDAQEWEEEASGAAQDWFNNTRDALDPNA